MKLSDINTVGEVAQADTLLLIGIDGSTNRIPFNNVVSAVYEDDNFRNNLINTLVKDDFFQNTAKATILAILEELGEMPENTTAAFLASLTAAQTAGSASPDVSGLFEEQTITVGPKVSLVVEDS